MQSTYDVWVSMPYQAKVLLITGLLLINFIVTLVSLRKQGVSIDTLFSKKVLGHIGTELLLFIILMSITLFV